MQFVSAPQFSLELSQARHTHLSENIQRCESRGNSQGIASSARQRCMSKCLHLSSLIRQWIPTSKFVSISAITCGDNEYLDQVCLIQSDRTDNFEIGYITDSEAILLRLAQYWTPFLDGSNTTIDDEFAARLLDGLPLLDGWDWSKIRFPSLAQFKQILQLMIDKSPGFDGLPYSTLNTLSETAVALMFKQVYQFCTFNSDKLLNLHGFNTIVQSNVPKKFTTPRGQGVAVAIDETRSLSCKNTDNKIVCKCMAQVLTLPIRVLFQGGTLPITSYLSIL